MTIQRRPSTARSWLCCVAAILCISADGSAQPARSDVVDSLRRVVAEDLRVATIAWRLQTSGVVYCQRRQRLSGLVVEHASQYGEFARTAAADLLNLRDLPTVVAVVPSSAGDLAGVKVGDEIASMNGASLLAGTPQIAVGVQGDAIHALILDRLRAGFNAGPVTMTLRRSGSTLPVRIEGTPACVSDVQIDLRSGLNSFADGQTVTIWQGMLDFVQDDDELAFAISHEIAHNVLGHPQRLRAAKSHAGLLGNVLGDSANVRFTEEQADYFALYLVAWAGYDFHAASGYMARYARRTPDFLMSPDHPGGGSRARALVAEAAEIDSKKSAGVALQPDEMP